MNRQKVIYGLFLVAFLGIATGAGLFFLEMNRELAMLRAQSDANLRRLADAREKLAAQERLLESLRRDPAMVERVIRRKLGYVRGQEFIFRFDETTDLP